MSNEEFQKLVLEQLSGLRNDVVDIKQIQLNMDVRLNNVEISQKNMEVRLSNMEISQKNMEVKLNNMEISQKNMEVRLNNMEISQKNMEVRLNNMEISQKNMEVRLNNMEISQKNMEIRQDEIYQVVKAIDHSNQVGKAELDGHEFRIAKMEGKFKKAGKIFDGDEIESASNL